MLSLTALHGVLCWVAMAGDTQGICEVEIYDWPSPYWNHDFFEGCSGI